ncbi:MAG: hypothetical protein GSR85_11500 [Desulfurococcales archaeon]|nr:hypothetical protein [Desulfurococcales archaeon]
MEYNWTSIIRLVRYSYPPHVELEFPANSLPPPESAGFKPSIGEKPGKHYRVPLPDGTGVHVRYYDGKYYIHWDKCDPLTRGVLCHWVNDAPHIIPIVGAALGLLHKQFSTTSAKLEDLMEGAIKGMIAGVAITILLNLIINQ